MNLKALQSYESSLHARQLTAYHCMEPVNLGQILLPTGTGKTRIQILSILKELTSLGKPGVALMAAHRLLLCEQLLKELLTLAFQVEIHFDVLTVASAGIDMEDVARINGNCQNLLQHCLVEQTTTGSVILDFLKGAKQRDRHVLIVSTYQSMDRLAGAHIDIACMDEAHKATEKGNFLNVTKVLPQIHKCYYFTATQVIVKGTSYGMNNLGVFGPTLYSMTPREAVDEGYILPPLLHKVTVSGRSPSNLSVLKAAFKAHRTKVLGAPANNGRIGPKLLVSAAGVEEIVDWSKSKGFFKWALDSGIHVVTFSSSKGYYINGQDVTRKDAMDKLLGLKDEDSAIILHYDILTEGIDLPNITGVMPFRELDIVKFKQTCGRAARLWSGDRTLLSTNPSAKSRINPKTNLVEASPLLAKPVFWVIITPTLSKEGQASESEQTHTLRESYELDPAYREIKEESTTSSVEEADSVIPDKEKTERESSYQADYSHEFEAYTFSELSFEDKQKTIDKFLDEMEAEHVQETSTSPQAGDGETPALLSEPVQERPQAGADKPTCRDPFANHVYVGG